MTDVVFHHLISILINHILVQFLKCILLLRRYNLFSRAVIHLIDRTCLSYSWDMVWRYKIWLIHSFTIHGGGGIQFVIFSYLVILILWGAISWNLEFYLVTNLFIVFSELTWSILANFEFRTNWQIQSLFKFCLNMFNCMFGCVTFFLIKDKVDRVDVGFKLTTHWDKLSFDTRRAFIACDHKARRNDITCWLGHCWAHCPILTLSRGWISCLSMLAKNSCWSSRICAHFDWSQKFKQTGINICVIRSYSFLDKIIILFHKSIHHIFLSFSYPLNLSLALNRMPYFLWATWLPWLGGRRKAPVLIDHTSSSLTWLIHNHGVIVTSCTSLKSEVVEGALIVLMLVVYFITKVFIDRLLLGSTSSSPFIVAILRLLHIMI